ncbi:LysR family transcriptional regulator [Streptomyces sp. NPDC052040]|uniref:LysR family transcriptional regulator n=1 Tax=unclassified Streptomyces TaxID=2593676 RepID=UPI0037CEF29A
MDLNLLIALDALLEENSVAAAADRLHLTPPAMSRTLGRIRKATGDDILVRTGRTMTPTPRALQLREETRELVRRATAVLTPVTTLDLEQLDRSFTLRCHDALVTALAPALISTVTRQAPRVAIRFLAEPSADVADLSRGQTDLEVGAGAPDRPEIATMTLGTDRMVAVLRPDHPLATGEITPERFAEGRHITVSRRGRLTGPIDAALAELGLHRRVCAALPTAGAALDLTARSDAVTVVAEQVCRPLWTSLGLVARPLPFQLPPVPVIVAWHHRYDSDPAHAWLRTQLATALRTIVEPSEPPDTTPPGPTDRSAPTPAS